MEDDILAVGVSDADSLMIKQHCKATRTRESVRRFHHIPQGRSSYPQYCKSNDLFVDRQDWSDKCNRGYRTDLRFGEMDVRRHGRASQGLLHKAAMRKVRANKPQVRCHFDHTRWTKNPDCNDISVSV